MEIHVLGQPSYCSELCVSFGLCVSLLVSLLGFCLYRCQPIMHRPDRRLTFFERSLPSGFKIVSEESRTTPGKVHHFDPRKLDWPCLRDSHVPTVPTFRAQPVVSLWTHVLATQGFDCGRESSATFHLAATLRSVKPCRVVQAKWHGILFKMGPIGRADRISPTFLFMTPESETKTCQSLRMKRSKAWTRSTQRFTSACLAYAAGACSESHFAALGLDGKSTEKGR
jgi:hypothetical protein